MYDSPTPEFGAMSEVSVPSSDRAATELVTQVTHEATGVTYHFAEPVEVGYYWNGDIFVVNNGKDIVIESITPESNPLGDARVMNGAVLQPDNDSFTAFDSSGQPGYYRDYENFEAHNVDPGKTGQPLVVKYSDHPGGASLVKAVSLEDLSEARDRSAIEEFSVLTVVAEAPPEGAFRPPVSGTDKTSHYTIDDLDFSKLQNVEILDSQKDISEFDLYKTATFASWTTSGDPARYTHPDKYHDGYGDYQMDAMAYAFMALHSNYSDAEKADLYAALVQTGIDYAGTVQDGKTWWALGGLNNQIKPFVVLAAVGLNSEELAEAADPATNAYSEDKQFRYVDEALIGAENFDWGGNKNPKLGEEYQEGQLGAPEWFIVEDGDRADPSLDAAYRWINSNNQPVTALVMEMLGDGEGRAVWNNEAYFDYADRIRNITDIELYKALHKPHDAWVDFVGAYADQFSTQPDWVGVPEVVSSLEALPNGAGITVRISGPKYDGGSEIIRTDFRYSADRENWETLEDVPDEFAITDLPENSPLFVQARYVNAVGEGPWTGNSFTTSNKNLVAELLNANLITEETISQNGGAARFTLSEAYKDALRGILDGADNQGELHILENHVEGFIVTGEGLSFASGRQYIDENVAAGTIVGALKGMEDGAALSYEIVGESEYFEIDGLNIVTKSELNYEEISEHQINVRVFGKDSVYDDQFSIKVNDVAEAVTDFVVSIDVIPEDAAVGSVVGTFSAFDDDGEPITFKSSGNPSYDNATFREYFEIVDDEVILIKSLDRDAFSSLRLLFYTSTPSGQGLNWTPYEINIGEPSSAGQAPEEPETIPESPAADPVDPAPETPEVVVEPETPEIVVEPEAPESPAEPEAPESASSFGQWVFSGGGFKRSDDKTPPPAPPPAENEEPAAEPEPAIVTEPEPPAEPSPPPAENEAPAEAEEPPAPPPAESEEPAVEEPAEPSGDDGLIGGFDSGEVTIELETPEDDTASGQWVFSGEWAAPDEGEPPAPVEIDEPVEAEEPAPPAEPVAPPPVENDEPVEAEEPPAPPPPPAEPAAAPPPAEEPAAPSPDQGEAAGPSDDDGLIGGFGSGEVEIELETPDVAAPFGQWVFSGGRFQRNDEGAAPAPAPAESDEPVAGEAPQAAPLGEMALSPQGSISFAGSLGDDFMSGLGGGDTMRAGGGDDTVLGGDGDDRIIGQAGDDRLVGQVGDDVVRGNAGADFLRGAAGDDTLHGNGGDDSLKGGAGDDVINGGRGDDVIEGNGGSDVFQFRAGDGADTIKGFQHGRDLIEITGGASGFGGLEISQSGFNVLIEFANVDITVAAARADQFNENDFVFS